MDHCGVCIRFLRPNRCVVHGPKDVISPKGWCKYFRRGEPGTSGTHPLGRVTKEESGYVADAERSMGKWK